MTKNEAIQLLGGSIASAAEAIGIKSQAVSQWPDDLPARISDRVIAALVRTRRAVPNEYKARPVVGNHASSLPMPGLSKRAQEQLKPRSQHMRCLVIEPTGSFVGRQAITKTEI